MLRCSCPYVGKTTYKGCLVTCYNVDAEYVLSRMGEEPIVDLRPAFMFDSSHIPNAHNIDYWSLASQDGPSFPEHFEGLLGEVGVGKGDPVILHCQMGITSAKACAVLMERGFTELRHYAGGFEDWGSDPFRPVE